MTSVWLRRPDFERMTEEALTKLIAGLAASAPFAQVQGAGLDRFCRTAADELLDEDDEPVLLTDLYDIRVFGGHTELRAIRRGQKWDVSECTENASESPKALAVEKFIYRPIVWGTAESNRNGWTILQSERVGAVAVPIETNARANLVVVEYRSHTQSGNAFLLHSRLAGIVATNTSTEVSDA